MAEIDNLPQRLKAFNDLDDPAAIDGLISINGDIPLNTWEY